VRKLICFLLVLLMLSGEITAKEDESFLIKRAYLDTIGVIPTQEEIEWYCVYNTNGYELAVRWLLNSEKYKWIMPKEYARKILLSREYRDLPKTKINKEQVYINLLFVTGKPLSLTHESIKLASLSLINNAIICSDGESEIIDYIANSLMCRGTNIDEINKLLKIFKESSKPEIEAWMDVLNAIMELEDVNTK